MQYNVIAVTGANSGLGRAICEKLSDTEHTYVIPVCGSNAEHDFGEHFPSFDLTNEEGVFEASQFIRQSSAQIDDLLSAEEGSTVYRGLINCAGINYIEWFESADWKKFEKLMNLNVRAGIELTQNLLSKNDFFSLPLESWFQGSGFVLNIISNASHVPMTNSVFYNATKGAFHIATLAMARELRKTHGLCVFGISPNKLSRTGMSTYIEQTVPALRGWTPEQAAAYQLGALPAGEETDPEELASFIAYLLERPNRHKFLTNTVIPYGA